MMRNQVSQRLKNGNDIYRRASAVYDPTKGHLQQLERSVVKQLAEAVEKVAHKLEDLHNDCSMVLYRLKKLKI